VALFAVIFAIMANNTGNVTSDDFKF